MFVFPKVAIFASGSGSNFEALVQASLDLRFLAKVQVLITDHSDAYCIKRAEKFNIPVVIVDYKEGKANVEAKILETLKQYEVEYIFLAGYMRVLSPSFVKQFQKKMLNVHPSALPKYPGLHAIEQALDNGDDTIGVTVHFVDEDVDEGPIINQSIFPIKGLTKEQIYSRVHSVEHELYIDAVKKVLEGDYE